jgi:hypothetical protein
MIYILRENFLILIYRKILFPPKKIDEKNLFWGQFDGLQQGLELAFFVLLFIHTCAQLWLHFFASLGYFRRLPPFFL